MEQEDAFTNERQNIEETQNDKAKELKKWGLVFSFHYLDKREQKGSCADCRGVVETTTAVRYDSSHIKQYSQCHITAQSYDFYGLEASTSSKKFIVTALVFSTSLELRLEVKVIHVTFFNILIQ